MVNPISLLSNLASKIGSLVKPKAVGKYESLYNKAYVLPPYMNILNVTKDRILFGKSEYEKLATILGNGIPWWFIGITHFMEAGHKYPNHFKYHLHCGDPLTARTVNVPKGRPLHSPQAGAGKPYTWQESALDALKLMKYDTPTDWSIEKCLERFERFNGMGYAKKGLRSPYLWSFTNLYSKGKYTSDGKYDPVAVSKQAGCAAIMLTLGIK